MKRALLTCTLTLVGVVAYCQTPAPAFDAVKWAFQNLAADHSIRIQVTGTETLDKTITPVTAELYWYLSDTAPTIAKVEFTQYRNGVVAQRSVGNGTQFYNYSPLKNNYWVTSYGTFGQTQPERYLPNLVDDFTSAMKGPDTYLARLLREAYVVNGFRAWVPGGSETLLVAGSPITTDPIVATRVYEAIDTIQYAMFWIGNPARKSVVFELTADDAGNYDVTRVFYAERAVVGGKTKITEWTAEIFRDFIPAADDFVFIPPANAKPVVGPRPNIG